MMLVSSLIYMKFTPFKVKLFSIKLLNSIEEMHLTVCFLVS